MLIPRRLAPLALAAILTTLGCHAQTTIAPGQTLPPAITHRIEVLLRQKAQLPPLAIVNVSAVTPSDVAGYSTVNVTFSSEGKTSHAVPFLISNDGKTIAQFTKYDIAADPRALVSPEGRPARGGPDSAPVVIVNFDDLECPYCARLHKTIFPAITQRYGDKVHIVYKDFPLEQHPWAMRAAVDVNCLAAQSPAGYWSLVDSIHDHASDIGLNKNPGTPGSASGTKEGSDVKAADAPKSDKPEHSLDRANADLDKLTRDEGAAEKVDTTKLNACLAKQDTSAIEASKQIGTALSIDSTPTMFINGDKIEGALPIGYIFGLIDDALRAENVTPPPPYVDPAPPVTPMTSPAVNPTK